MQRNPKFIIKQVTILSISDNKIWITVDDKRIPTCNQRGNLSAIADNKEIHDANRM